MQRRSQGPSENTVEYFFDKICLCKALNFGLNETRTHVAVGLWSRSTSTAIMNRSYFDLDELLRSIQELESLEAARKQRIGAKQETSAKSSADDKRGSAVNGRPSAQRSTEAHRSSGPDRSGDGQHGVEKHSRRGIDGQPNATESNCFRCHAPGQRLKIVRLNGRLNVLTVKA